MSTLALPRLAPIPPTLKEVRLSGVAPLSQFYGYGGRSDADTMTFLPGRATWRPIGETEWRSISLDFFRNAAVDAGRGDRKPILRLKRVGDRQEEAMTLRLQGVDAPELHYEAVPAIPLENMTSEVRERWIWEGVQFRQHGSIQATCAVAGALDLFTSPQNPDHIPLTAHSWVTSPGDHFDVYGRFVSEILLGPNDTSLNLWMIAQGWALPSFYDSMSHDEIYRGYQALEEARANRRGLWDRYRDRLPVFDWELQLPQKGEPAVAVSEDAAGGFCDPKLFRQQVHYCVNRRAELVAEKTLQEYLKRKSEFWIPREIFLQDASTEGKRPLAEVVGPRGHILIPPWDRIYLERPAVLKDLHGNEIREF